MPTDQMVWVEKLGNDNEETDRDAAIAELRTILLRGLRGAFFKRGQDEAFCEDVCQEAMLRILNNLDSFEGRSKFTTWAISIAIRVGISDLRRRHHKDVSLDAITSNNDMSFDIAIADELPPGNDIDRKALLGTLADLIENDLTEKQRLVVRALLGGMPVEEIAARTDSNRNAVYKLFHDAKLRLKKGFEAQNYTSADIQSILA